jgi:hypothetical protein
MPHSLPLEQKAADLKSGGLRYPLGVKAATSIINPIQQTQSGKSGRRFLGNEGR